MLSIKFLAVRFLTAVAILLVGSTLTNNVYADQMRTLSFGFWKTLDDEQMKAYYATLRLAVLDADNGQSVTWYINNASGSATPVFTRPTGTGYCRRIHVQVIAHGVERLFQETVCYNNATRQWQWLGE